MEIRAAKLENWSMIWDLFFLMGKTDSQEKVKERFEAMINSEQHYIPVAILEQKVVGYGWVQDYGFHLRAGKKISRLNDLFVLPDHRNMGVARKLFFSIKDWA
ncbi:GNAT family N-acetyltransferase [Bacillaceae bacterium CLA-AA-H227]|uniref:GNAT family N-acetyltransferase n=1 Tax=Robertmurraya yapensis (ex Hitch et al 2024) TaxID=3133160 RepID=A0ACC6SDF1_9BACI